jgi:hypothetical protein
MKEASVPEPASGRRRLPHTAARQREPVDQVVLAAVRFIGDHDDVAPVG